MRIRRIQIIFLVFVMFVCTLTSCKQNAPDQLESQTTDSLQVTETDHLSKNDEIVKAFNEHRQLGYEKRFVRGPKSVAFITDAGNIVCVGQEDQKTLDELSQWTNVIELSAHGLGYIGLAKDGHVYSTSDLVHSNLDMMVTPLNDIKKAVGIMVTKGYTDENRNVSSNNCAVLLLVQGGPLYDSVANIK